MNATKQSVTICNEIDACSGCFSCFAKCRHNAITFITHDDGFLYPRIDEKKCNDCGLCKKVCPANKEVSASKILPLDAYLAVGDELSRENSSSSGYFYTIAKHIINKGGYVVGCVLRRHSDGSFYAVHELTNDISTLQLMRGSKYIQSDVSHVYAKIKELLIKGALVLFSGTPCEVAGLRQFVGTNKYKLLTIDLICHGVTSAYVLNKCLEEELSTLNLSKDLNQIKSICFRDKSIENFTFSFKVHLDDGTEQIIHRSVSESWFYKVFNANLALRRSCGQCRYGAKKPREGDLTIGDFRGVKGFRKFCDSKGTSIVLINTFQGKLLFKSTINLFKVIKQLPLSDAAYSQANLRGHSFHHINRENFIHLIHKFTISEAIMSINNSINKNIGVLNFHFEQENYGAVLTSAALLHVLESLGYNARNIDYHPYFHQKNVENPLFDSFRRDNIPTTERYDFTRDLLPLNYEFGIFITGSDQVFNHSFIKEEWPVYLLAFADSSHKTISCAGSFGRNTNDYLSNLTARYKYLYGKLMSRLDGLSVREENSGKAIVEVLSGRNAFALMDPVFLCGRSFWLNMIEKSDVKFDKATIAVYELLPENALQDAVKSIYPECVCLNAYRHTPYDFISIIKNSKLLVTNSFHGMCFALILNTPFVVIGRENEKMTRMTRMRDLLSKIDPSLEHRLVCANDIDLQSVIEKLPSIDWAHINQRLESLVDISNKYLCEILEMPLSEDQIGRKKSIISEISNHLSLYIKSDLLRFYVKRSLYKLVSIFKSSPKLRKKIIKLNQRIKLRKLQLRYLKKVH